MKIKTKITFNFTLIVGALLLLFSIIVYFFSDYYREEQFYSRLKDKAMTTATLLFEVEEVDSVLLRIIQSADQTLLFEEKVIIYNKSFEKIYESREEIPPAFSIRDISNLKDHDMKRLKAQGSEILFLKIFEQGEEYYVFASAYDKYGYSKINNLLQIIVICLLTSISLLILAGRYFARKLLDPISNIIHQVEKIDMQNISSRVDGGRNKDEISILASTFNSMLERLEEAFVIQKNFVSNASHELRTPLTAIIGQIDVAMLKERNTEEYISTLKSIKEDISGFVELSNKLLLLA
jgi:methyl-accepting chemotaxis protein